MLLIVIFLAITPRGFHGYPTSGTLISNITLNATDIDLGRNDATILSTYLNPILARTNYTETSTMESSRMIIISKDDQSDPGQFVFLENDEDSTTLSSAAIIITNDSSITNSSNEEGKVESKRYDYFYPPIIPIMESFVQDDFGIDDLNVPATGFPNDLFPSPNSPELPKFNKNPPEHVIRGYSKKARPIFVPSFTLFNDRLHSKMDKFKELRLPMNGTTLTNLMLSPKNTENDSLSNSYGINKGILMTPLQHSRKKIKLSELLKRYHTFLHNATFEKRVREFLRYLHYRNARPSNSFENTFLNSIVLPVKTVADNTSSTNNKRYDLRDVHNSVERISVLHESLIDPSVAHLRPAQLEQYSKDSNAFEGKDMPGKELGSLLAISKYLSDLQVNGVQSRTIDLNESTVEPAESKALSAFLKNYDPFGVASLHKVLIHSNSINRDETEWYDEINRTPLFHEDGGIYNQTYRILLQALTATPDSSSFYTSISSSATKHSQSSDASTDLSLLYTTNQTSQNPWNNVTSVNLRHHQIHNITTDEGRTRSTTLIIKKPMTKDKRDSMSFFHHLPAGAEVSRDMEELDSKILLAVKSNTSSNNNSNDYHYSLNVSSTTVSSEGKPLHSSTNDMLPPPLSKSNSVGFPPHHRHHAISAIHKIVLTSSINKQPPLLLPLIKGKPKFVVQVGETGKNSSKHGNGSLKIPIVFSRKDITREEGNIPSQNVKHRSTVATSHKEDGGNSLGTSSHPFQGLKSISIKKLEEQQEDAIQKKYKGSDNAKMSRTPTTSPMENNRVKGIKKSAVLELISKRVRINPDKVFVPTSSDFVTAKTNVNDNTTTPTVDPVQQDATNQIKGNGKNEADVCLTPQCVEIAASILSSMDQTVNPCTNFYNYACGKWDREHVIPEGESKVTPFTELSHQLNVKIKGLLEEPIEASDRKSVKKVKSFYESCINESYTESVRVGPLLQFINEHGGWPVLYPPDSSHTQRSADLTNEGEQLSSRFVNDNDNFRHLIHDESHYTDPDTLNRAQRIIPWDENSFDPITTIANLRRYGINILFREGLNPDKGNSSIYIVEIDQPKFRFMRDYYLKDDFEAIMKSYLAFMIGIAEYLGADSRSQAELELNQTLSFEIQLANISSSQSRNSLPNYYTRMTVAELIKEIPQIDWLKYFGTLMPNINESDLIGVPCLDYFKNLGLLLSQTPKRVLANFIMWKTVHYLIQYTNRDLIDMERAFNKVVGSSSFKPRWKICVYNTLRYFPLVNAHLFLQKYFDTETKESILNMSKEIKKVFNERLPQIEWMDNQTRIVAQKKADFIIKKIAYPDLVADLEYLDNVNIQVNVTKERYFDNVLAFENHISQNDHKYFRKYVNRTEWKDTIMDVNAYYHWNMNYIIIPAGILQPPFYKNGYPKSVNYGRIGFIIGHETTHAFDSSGSLYNEFGNQKEWWSKEITKRFEDKASCIIRQYGNYTIPDIGINLNGFKTQSENIADNGGIKQAYAAFKKSEITHGKDFKLPGLILDHDQIFFLSYAQIWCGLTRRSKIISDLHTLSHPFEHFRVLGTLSNFPVFAEAYKCPIGSPMNPIRKCSVW